MQNSGSGSVIKTLLIAVAVVVSAILLANSWERSHLSNANKQTISVTGKAEKNFVSDLIVWQGSYLKKSASLKEAYQLLKNDNTILYNYLSEL